MAQHESESEEQRDLMLMGSVDSLPEAPKERTKFIEDMTELEAAAAVSWELKCDSFCI